MSIDTELLFNEAAKQQTATWQIFLAQLHRIPYLNYQTPFPTFYIAQSPRLATQQLLWLPVSFGVIGLLFALYGRAAALLCATPLFALMVTQPSHDLLLFAGLLIALRLIQMQRPGLAALAYGVTWWIKPLTLLTLPYFLWHLRGYSVISLTIWAMYIGWSQAYQFGVLQGQFLMQQLMIYALFKTRTPAAVTHGTIAKKPGSILGTLRYRWHWLTQPALLALPCYLFPTYARHWQRFGVLLLAVILVGYGQIKYTLIDLLFLFPVQPLYLRKSVDVPA